MEAAADDTCADATLEAADGGSFCLHRRRGDGDPSGGDEADACTAGGPGSVDDDGGSGGGAGGVEPNCGRGCIKVRPST